MSEFQDYPMMLSHPNAKKGQAIAVTPGDPNTAYVSTPDLLPPVMVEDPEQRAYYEAQGYVCNGTSDPAAFAQAVANPIDPAYVPQEYPKYVGDVLVNNQDEELALMVASDGPTVEGALEPAVSVN